MKRLAVIALMVSACGGAAKPEVAAPDDVEPDVAVREARDLIEEAYGSLRRGDANGLLPLLAPDVFIVGPRAADVLPAGSDALVTLTDALEAAKVKKHTLKSRDLQVVASSGGHAAWATDQIELDGATYAMIAVLTHEDDLWTFRAVHVAQTWKPKQLGKRTPVPGAAFPEPTLDPAAKELLGLAQEAILDLDEREDQLPDVEADAAFDVVVVSTSPKGATHGVKKIKKAWKKARKKEDPVMPEPVGAAAFGFTDDGSIAWVCANVTTEDEPHRMFLLYAKDDGAWRLMAIQTAAITD